MCQHLLAAASWPLFGAQGATRPLDCVW
jgi:acyl carrier protein